MEKDKLPNLRTAYESKEEDINKYNKYKEINDLEGEYIYYRKGYYKFLLDLLKSINDFYLKPYDGKFSVKNISMSREYDIFDQKLVPYIESFLSSWKIGEINLIEKIMESKHRPNIGIYKYLIHLKCSFEEFFKAIYGEIQFMEYYEKSPFEASQELESIYERDIDRYGEYIHNNLGNLRNVLPNMTDKVFVPYGQLYRVMKALESQGYFKQDGIIINMADIFTILTNLGFTKEKIVAFTGCSEELVNEFVNNGKNR